ncbi:MAG: hypothetical protein Q7T04_01430, partial [Dehalococcoidia bacterium]|nr:hypothetical protein [Dehalococcoidia bacterium]
MSDNEQTLLSPLKLILFVAADGRMPHELAGRTKTLNALLEDRGKSMSPEMRARWTESIAEAVSDCSQNRHGMEVETQKLCATALSALKGRFCEIVEQDHLMAAKHYEEAAELKGHTHGMLRTMWSVKNDTKPQEEVDENLPLYERIEVLELQAEVWL